MTEFEARIAERGAACGLELDPTALTKLARHARAVLESSPTLKLTALRADDEFLERHLGEAFEGAALLPRGIRGTLLDLGSGNGYPGIPMALIHPALELWMAEASRRKSMFLAALASELELASARVLARHVERASDLDTDSLVRVIVTRAMGGWDKIVPRLTRRLEPDARVLLWAGPEVDEVRRRKAWARLRLLERRALPGRERSWIWLFGFGVGDDGL